MIESNVSRSCAWCALGSDGTNERLDENHSEHNLSPTGHLVVAVCLGFIGTFGFLNNTLVLVIFCRYKVLRSPMNCLLVSISVSDLLVCVLGTPFSFAASTQGRWLIGQAGCVWYGFANSFLGVVSLISLAVLSYERYCTMMGATQADSTNYRKVAMGIAFSWIYSMVWTIPPLFGWSRYGPEGPGTTCSVNWTAKTANNVSYIVCLFIFCLILPFAVIVYSYGRLLQAITQFCRCFHALLMCTTPERGSSFKNTSNVTRTQRTVRRANGNNVTFAVASTVHPTICAPHSGGHKSSSEDGKPVPATGQETTRPVVSLVAYYNG
ncbi:teleost multiple tissue opsin b isoform X2 [Triplophysa rosa]|uniref:teleost multiple tissue opsin b isoform X2 n=1 Tax=Triplophysa rosa TaxID=992332 RepID=UPI002545C042|nr:teleost multiple tissue opsin b isoform X2 [Triplophysa rosa]